MFSCYPSLNISDLHYYLLPVRSPSVCVWKDARLERRPAADPTLAAAGLAAPDGATSPDLDNYGFARGREVLPAALVQGEPSGGVRDCEGPAEPARGVRDQAVPQHVCLVLVAELDNY